MQNKSNITNMKEKEIIIYGNMEWFEVADQPADLNELPTDFKKAYELWKSDSEKNSKSIIKLLAPFVEALFLPSNLASWDEIFADPLGLGLPEYKAFAVRVVGIDFKSSPIPLCKAEGLFKVQITPEYRAISDIDEWQGINGFFADCLTFRWNIPLTEKIDGLDFTHASNEGSECVPDFVYSPADWMPSENSDS
jgi:hypothetical protein